MNKRIRNKIYKIAENKLEHCIMIKELIFK